MNRRASATGSIKSKEQDKTHSSQDPKEVAGVTVVEVDEEQ